MLTREVAYGEAQVGRAVRNAVLCVAVVAAVLGVRHGVQGRRSKVSRDSESSKEKKNKQEVWGRRRE